MCRIYLRQENLVWRFPLGTLTIFFNLSLAAQEFGRKFKRCLKSNRRVKHLDEKVKTSLFLCSLMAGSMLLRSEGQASRSSRYLVWADLTLPCRVCTKHEAITELWCLCARCRVPGGKSWPFETLRSGTRTALLHSTGLLSSLQ